MHLMHSLERRRLLSAGDLDMAFGDDGLAIADVGPEAASHATAVQADGKILVAGSQGSNALLVRFLPDGSIDASFGEIHAGAGDDSVYGNGGKDTLNGSDGRDRLDGGRSNDVLRGGDQADTLIGGEGSDELFGEGSNDHFYAAGDRFGDFLFGGGGTDSARADEDDELLSIEVQLP